MDERKNNILFLEQFGNHIGGGQIILLGILEYLQKTNQWNIFVSLPEEGVFTDLLRSKGFECVITPMVKHSMKSSFLVDISRYSFTSIRSAYTLSKLIQKHRIKIVYCNGGRTFMSSILLSLIHPVSLYWHIHLILDSRQNQMVTIFGRSRKVKKLIAVSEAAKDAFNGSQVYYKTDVIPNWVRPEFLSAPVKLIHEHRKHPIKVAVIGLISKEKGQTILLETLNACQKPLPIEIIFAGSMNQEDSEHEKKFNNLVDHLSSKGWKVKVEGFKSNIVNLLDRMDLLLIPSLVAESFGLTAIEAMSRNVVVIANKVGALSEVIHHGINGFFYRSDHPKSLIDLLLKIVNNKISLSDIRINGYRTVIEKFHPEKQIKKINYLIKQSIVEPVNILHVNGSSKNDIFPQAMYRLICQVDKSRFNVTIASPGEPKSYSRLKDFACVSHYSVCSRKLTIGNILPLIKLVKARKIHIVYSQGKSAGLRSRLLKLVFPRLIVVHLYQAIHDTKFSNKYLPFSKYFETALSLLSDKLVFISQSQCNEAKSRFKFNSNKSIIIKNDLQSALKPKFEVLEYRKRLNLPQSAFIGIASIDFPHKKNLNYLFKIIEKIGANNIPIYFVLTIENNNIKQTIVREIEQRKISEKFTLINQAMDVYPWLYASNFYLSISGSKVFPLPLLDIMSATLPIVSNDDASSNCVIDGKTGFLIPSGDLDQFQKTIIRLYKDKELCKDIRKEGRRFVQSNRSHQDLRNFFVEVHNDLYSQKKSNTRYESSKSKKNKILLDARLIRGSGISTYISNLLKEYSNIDHQLDINILVNSINQIKSSQNLIEEYNIHIFNKRIYSLSEQIFLPSVMKNSNILHVPHYNAPLAYKGILIVTIHDICHYAMRQYFPGIPKRLYSSVFLNKVLQKANQIIVVSQFTKDEILKYFSISREKIEVIHNGIDPFFYRRNNKEIERVKQSYNLPSEYFLYVGNIRPHKNVAGLIKGYAFAFIQDSSIPPLVLCGVCQIGYDVFKELDEIPAAEKEIIKKRVIFTGYFKYQDMPALYSGAIAFLYLSLYEGFGIPPLEAMACGTPVIISSTSALPEICGDSAYQVDPFNLNEIALAIKTILYDKHVVNKLNAIAFKRIKRYSWSTSAEKHLAIYERWSN